MSKAKKSRSSSHWIPPQQSIVVDKRDIVAKKQHLLAMSLLGDLQQGIVGLCAAMRVHRTAKWPDGEIGCEIDTQLYAALDFFVEKFSLLGKERLKSR